MITPTPWLYWIVRKMLLRAVLMLHSAAMLSCVSIAPESSIGPARNIEKEGHFEVRLERLIDHERDNWNYLGIWRRVGKQAPAVYVPAEMPATVPLDTAHGMWVVDRNDGARFFVPKAGTKRYEACVLRAEAQKATNTMTGRQRTMLNGLVGVVGVGLAPLEFLQAISL